MALPAVTVCVALPLTSSITVITGLCFTVIFALADALLSGPYTVTIAVYSPSGKLSFTAPAIVSVCALLFCATERVPCGTPVTLTESRCA